ncbi:PREDICTED: fatty acyl-CoA reductase 1-like [Tarenaya hassleriana]|uniref:fatty acyl-CoA reductase 1-like n=1 Tax=Tarenaya hassleriana TaxID=28532 RepID=UPI00053C69D6|nr:PREDICTED: fatty acyl-CoA reductase 1-like [Tarenaya hassleriana]
MEPNCVQFLHNKTILVTGASGFLAKVFVEKILRVQPNVKKLYLLVRAPDKEAAMQRLRSEVIEKDLFKVLRNDLGVENLNKLVSEKVVPVPGDISVDDLGVGDSDLKQRMRKDIDVVVNVAATTNFDERYDVGLGINTFGALNVLNFAKSCVNPQLLLHVSTAYVCGEKSGLLMEKPFAMGETLNGNDKLDISTEMEVMRQKLKELRNQECSEEEITNSLKDLGMKRAKLHGWPNTYVFTKAMGEMLLGSHRESMPLVIIRPTMITSTLSEPFPGWIEGLRTIDSVIVAYGKGRLKCFLADPNSVFDLIPVDMVANAMIVAAAANASDSEAQKVYHVGSSCKNPVTFGQLHDFSARYFTKTPLVGRNGSPIVVSNGTIIPSMLWFSLYITLRYKLPLQLLWLINIIYPWRYGDKYKESDRKIKLVMRLVELYKPYVLFKGIFDDINSERLRVERGEGLFNFDPRCINWEDYMINTHIHGLVTHVLRK